MYIYVTFVLSKVSMRIRLPQLSVKLCFSFVSSHFHFLFSTVSNKFPLLVYKERARTNNIPQPYNMSPQRCLGALYSGCWTTTFTNLHAFFLFSNRKHCAHKNDVTPA
ncbi:hypothetical protein CIPAW_09G105300 [Carya illinoinensis]|uniref:Uncharacterized protein n=1 Tax=Carya illinoinensis TaxID=32201 RepID=A0A8T1PJC5_CARIL|nr:hypothetical protein CIPAW_09G105300 [Carya illinoinensis]